VDHEPTADEIAQLLDRPIGDVERMLGLNERIASMDVPCGKDGDKLLVDTIEDKRSEDPTGTLQQQTLARNIDHWLGKLNPKQREVVERRFGLHGYENSTLEQVASEIGVTRERVRQIQMDALRRLRVILERDGFSLEMIFEEL
jgi:RNA polymerase nonessential primary-like sigma factor